MEKRNQNQKTIMEFEVEHLEQEKKQEGFLYAWGKNSSGCLGNKKEENCEDTPLKLEINEKFIQISTGGLFAAAISIKNELYTWGQTKNGRNGQGTLEQRCITFPKKIQYLQNITKISCGNWHCLALNIQNQLFVTGHNKYGSCGLPENNEIANFTLNNTVAHLKITDISAGDGFSLFLDNQKIVYSCGFRSRHGNKENNHQEIIKKIESLSNIPIRHINAGFTHAAVVSDSIGEVYTWGSSDFYQLGHGNTKSVKTPQKIENLLGISQVSCSRGEKNCHTMATSFSGEVYSWGGGYKGKLGHSSKWTHEDPADEPHPRMIQYLQEKTILINRSIAGGIHSAVLTSDNKLMTFGCGSDGRLGHPEVSKYVYLYREPLPRQIQGIFLNNSIVDVSSSYYFMIAIAER